MNAVGLFLADGTTIAPHLCGKCARIWESADSAERCCKCSFCDGYVDWMKNVSHDECSERRHAEAEATNLAKAALVTDYTGPFIIDDRFYFGIDDLLERFTEAELPEYGFCTDEQQARIDISDVIAAVAEQMHAEWEEAACEELEGGIAMWNKANEGNSSYFPCNDRKWSRVEILKLRAALREGVA